MRVDWPSVLAGLIVTWPPVLAGWLVSWRRARKRLDAVTRSQTQAIAEITAAQTAVLLGREPEGVEPA